MPEPAYAQPSETPAETRERNRQEATSMAISIATQDGLAANFITTPIATDLPTIAGILKRAGLNCNFATLLAAKTTAGVNLPGHTRIRGNDGVLRDALCWHSTAMIRAWALNYAPVLIDLAAEPNRDPLEFSNWW